MRSKIAGVEDITAFDVALQRNDREWFEPLSSALEEQLILKLYHEHFFCHVFHQDYIVREFQNCLAIELQMWNLLDHGAEHPD